MKINEKSITSMQIIQNHTKSIKIITIHKNQRKSTKYMKINKNKQKMPAKAAGFGSMFFERNIMLNDNRMCFNINNWSVFGRVADSCYSIKLNNLGSFSLKMCWPIWMTADDFNEF